MKATKEKLYFDMLYFQDKETKDVLICLAKDTSETYKNIINNKNTVELKRIYVSISKIRFDTIVSIFKDFYKSYEDELGLWVDPSVLISIPDEDCIRNDNYAKKACGFFLESLEKKDHPRFFLKEKAKYILSLIPKESRKEVLQKVIDEIEEESK